MPPIPLGLPSPAEIFDEPQRAILASLDTNLVLAIRTLKARHPDLDDHDAHEPLPLLAEALLACALSLHSVLVTYDDLARRVSRMDGDDSCGEDDDIPF